MGKGGMDYKGQKLSEQIYLVLIPAVGSVAWVFGYLAQDFKQTFYGCARGVPRRCLHTMRRLQERRSWVVSFSILSDRDAPRRWLAGLVLAMLICVPDWPIFNRNPTPWLEEIPSARKQTVVDDDDEDEAPASKGKKQKKKGGNR